MNTKPRTSILRAVHALILLAVFAGVYLTVDGLLDHSTAILARATVLLAAIGTTSLTHTHLRTTTRTTGTESTR